MGGPPLLELARVLSLHAKYTLQWVFFDGEEAQKWTETDSLCSRYFVAQLAQEARQSTIKAMILLDMIGDKDLVLERIIYISLMEIVRKSDEAWSFKTWQRPEGDRR